MSRTRAPRRRDVVLVISVREYLHQPLVDLVRHLYGADTPIIAVRAWRGMDLRLVARLLLWDLPFRIGRIFTPSDLGGRLVRVIMDLAGLFGIESYVVPAHNHPFHLDTPLPLYKRYLDLSRPRVIGGFSRRARLIMNDDAMRRFFLSMGYDAARLVEVRDWFGALYRRPRPVEYPVVFFTEVMQTIDKRQFDTNLARIVRLLEEGAVPSLHVKLHPREPDETKETYRRALGAFPGVTFLPEDSTSIDVINRSAVVIASFSTVLLEALWLGRRVIVLDNPVFRKTMLASYLDDDNHLLYDDALAREAVRRYCLQETGT